MDRRDAIRLSGASVAAGIFGAPALAAAATDSGSLQPIIDYLAHADAVADRLGYNDPALRPAYHQHVMTILASAHIQVFGTRVDAPDWVPYLPFYLPIGGPNADDCYRYVPIDARGTYRFHGIKGTGVLAVLTMKNGGARVGRPGPGKTLAEIDLNAVKTDADGSYEFLLSAERPAGQSGEWYAMHPETTQMMMRLRLKNPTQRDPTCLIERLDTAIGPSFPTAEEIAQRMNGLFRFASAQNEFMLNYLKVRRERGSDKGFIYDDQSNFGGLVTQKYLMYDFTLAEGEALILESEVPKSYRYWSVNLFDAHFNGIDYVMRQSALNDEQAHIDADGRVRCVISAVDPGIPNWLDTGGWPRGGVLWRWNNADSYPLPRVTRVALADLRAKLPSDTPVLSAAERRTALRKRSDFYRTRGR
jgi:Protein of unknown function (DUF1214)